MSLASSNITIGTTATLIATGKVGASWIYLHAPSGGNAVYIGNSNVTTANGLELAKGQVIALWIAETDNLYGVVATATQPLMVLQSGGR